MFLNKKGEKYYYVADIQVKRLFFICLVFFVIILKTYSDSKIKIGIFPPYIRNESPATMFYYKNYVFEFLFNNDKNKYLVEIINVETASEESLYLKNCKEEIRQEGVDYFLYATVQSTDDYLFFNVQLLNPYNNEVVFSKFFTQKIDYAINDSLSESVKKIIKTLKKHDLKRAKVKVFTKKENKTKKEEDGFKPLKIKYKHEVFFLNGFLKNHPNIMSFLEIYSGYNFSPFDFFCVESGIFLGLGYEDANFYIRNIIYEDFFLGTYFAFYFYLSGFIEPSVGLRLDFTYILNKNIRLTLPIDFGVKFYIKNKNAIRFNTSIQFICYDFETLQWQNNFLIGFLIGYARKI